MFSPRALRIIVIVAAVALLFTDWTNRVSSDAASGERINAQSATLAPMHIQSLAAGEHHTCALLTDGVMRCWGNNGFGQLGTGDEESSNIPVSVKGLPEKAIAIATGAQHTCAQLQSGSVRCWGRNDYGQIGDGTTSVFSEGRPTPRQVVGLERDVVAIATANGEHTCALLRNGIVKCWGWNNFGQLGDGSTQDGPVPVAVVGLQGKVQMLAVGELHTCALLEGKVKCWGYNRHGPLGDGTNLTRLLPVDVVGLTTTVSYLGTGSWHTCAMSDGNLACWGENYFGQLGNGGTSDSFVPVSVRESQSKFEIVLGGREHTCGIVIEGRVKCWGNNGDGQLGDGTTVPRGIPTDVYDLPSSIVALAVGEAHGCALTIHDEDGVK